MILTDFSGVGAGLTSENKQLKLLILGAGDRDIIESTKKDVDFLIYCGYSAVA